MLLSFALLLFQLPSFNPASCPELYWRVGYNGPCKTRGELDDVIKLHKQWIESSGTSGKRASLRGAILSSDDLRGVNLWGADLSGSVLNGANLSGAILGPSRQGRQDSSAGPGAFVIAPPTLLSAVVDGVVPAFPLQTDLQNSSARKVDFQGADLSNSELEFGDLSDSDLSDADLTGANLSHARLVGTRLNHANVRDADLFEVVLEPSSIDGVVGLYSAKHLESVTFETSPSGLIQLRKLLRDQGFLEQERKLTYALNHRQANLESWIERWFKNVAFDLTCQYGMNPGRCLRLVFLLWAVFSAFFYVAIHRRGWMLLRATRRIGQGEKTRELIMWSRPDTRSIGIKRQIAHFKFEWRVIRASTFFSLVNAFSIGYKEFSIGQWLLLISRRQYEIRPSGWARTLAGIQSLLTVYLFALWLLTYFGQPFE